MCGCVFAVSFNSSSVPSKHIFEMEKPSAWSASSNTARAAGYFSASSLPMPGVLRSPDPEIRTLLFPSSLPLRPCAQLHRQAAFPKILHPPTSVAKAPARSIAFTLALGQTSRHANRIFHGVRIRTAMPNHANAAPHPAAARRRTPCNQSSSSVHEARSATTFPQLRDQRALHRFSQQAKKLHRKPFAIFSAIFPTNPSQTTTSTSPEKRSPPSTLPM